MVGLGRIGANMVRLLMNGGHCVVVSDRSTDTFAAMAKEAAVGSSSLDDLVKTARRARAGLGDVPLGRAYRDYGAKLARCSASDVVIDGGNSSSGRRGEGPRSGAQGHHLRRRLWQQAAECGPRSRLLPDGGGTPEAFKVSSPSFRRLAPVQGSIEPTPGRKPGGTPEGYPALRAGRRVGIFVV